MTIQITPERSARVKAIVSSMRERVQHQSDKDHPTARELLRFIEETAAELEKALISEPVAAENKGGESVESERPTPGPRDFQECLDEVVETRRDVLQRLEQPS